MLLILVIRLSFNALCFIITPTDQYYCNISMSYKIMSVVHVSHKIMSVVHVSHTSYKVVWSLILAMGAHYK